MTKNTSNTRSRKPKKTSKGRKRKPSRRISRKKKLQIKISIWSVIAILLGVGIWTIRPYICDKSSPERGDTVPKGAYCYGIDISHYQEKIQWDSLMVLSDGARRTVRSKIVARDIKPVSFVFIKATEGSSMKDKKFKHHWKEAEKRNITKGAYHFFRSSKSGEIQARHFIRTVGEISPDDLPPVLDIETIHKGCSHKTLNDRVLDYLKTITEHYGRKPIIYSSASFIENILSDEIKKNYPIWVAHYGTDRPRCANWHIWQFTDKAVVYGIDGYTDLNVCSSEFLKSLQ
jgi:lysozyme